MSPRSHLETRPCSGSVADVVGRLTEALETRGIDLFAVVDHAAGARAAGLELPDEVLMIFGKPAVGTAIMQADPASGIELPLRMLVLDEAGSTRVAWEPPSRLADRFDVASRHEVLQRLDALLADLATAIG